MRESIGIFNKDSDLVEVYEYAMASTLVSWLGVNSSATELACRFDTSYIQSDTITGFRTSCYIIENTVKN